jgi:hypothetical protein
MSTYEIRLRKRNIDPESIYQVDCSSDFAAVRNAKKTAGEEGTFEVWKDDQCIFSTHPLLTVLH